MKIRLLIAAGSGGPTSFEHAGPVIRIGRDADCDLSLQGEASKAVSRQHAHIELRADGATLTDAGSSNGTLLNDKPLKGSAPLRVGDRIQMGFTGATLTVVELDLGIQPVGKAARVRPALAFGFGSAVALVAVLVVVLWPRKPNELPKEPDEFAQGPNATAPAAPSPKGEKPPLPAQTQADSVKQPPAPLPPPPTAIPPETGRGDPLPPPIPPPPPSLQDDTEPLARGPVHEAYAQPVDYQPQPSPIIAKKPPEPLEELPPDQKPDGEDLQWLAGYWAWDDDSTDYLWVSGLWRVAPPGRHWLPGAWQEVEGGWLWSPGFWASDETQQVDYVPDPPPSVDAGPSSPASQPSDVYAPGTWIWREARWAWRPGYWVPSQPGWVWTSARYAWTPGGSVFLEGYWDRPLEQRGLLSAPVRVLRRSGEWIYAPRHVVGVDFLLGALFVGPRRHHYHFGDYFGHEHAHHGFVPFLHYRPTPSSHDPLYNHYRQVFRGDPAWERDLHKLYQARLAGEVPRPPHTWGQQEQVLASLKAKHTEDANLLKDVPFTHAQGATALTRLAKGHEQRVTRLAALAPRAKVEPAPAIKTHLLKGAERAGERGQIQHGQQVAQMRRDHEAKLLAAGAAHGKPAQQPKVAPLVVPPAPVARTRPAVKPPPAVAPPRPEQRRPPAYTPPPRPNPPRRK